MSQPRSLRFGFVQIPEEGLRIEFEESFSGLYASNEERFLENDPIAEQFQSPIRGSVDVIKVKSKVDCRGSFETEVSGPCDRCLEPIKLPLKGELTAFLMPKKQFSSHDRPGGKVIHGKSREKKPSRHHSKSKSAVLSEADSEHEDIQFGAFDGITVDLRPLLREELILQAPMRMVCELDSEGLCPGCGKIPETERFSTRLDSKNVEFDNELNGFASKTSIAEALMQKAKDS